MKEAICALNGYVNLYCKHLHKTSLDEVKRKKMKSRIVSFLPLNVISKKECEKTGVRTFALTTNFKTFGAIYK
jgi:hypothetical protein